MKSSHSTTLKLKPKALMVCYQITYPPITQSVIAGLVPEVQGTTQEVAKAKCRAAADLVSVH